MEEVDGRVSVDRVDLVGSAEDSDVIIVDDVVDPAGTLCKASSMLTDYGVDPRQTARRVFAFASHGLFNDPANHRVADGEVSEVVALGITGNTLSADSGSNPKIIQLSSHIYSPRRSTTSTTRISMSALFK
eukprot:g3668.t1